MMTFWIFWVVFSVDTSNGQAVVKLASLKTNLMDSITVSGFSSGGAMATQMHVAHSYIIKAMGGFSSTFYRCGPGGHFVYSQTCTKNTTLVSRSLSDARAYEKAGKIDPLSNLQTSKVFVWSGTEDTEVPTPVVKKVADFYGNFMPNTSIRFVSQLARHEFPTDDYGPTCPEPTSSYIGNCNFSGGYEVLSHLLGPTIKRPAANIQTKQLIYFNQSEFTSGPPKDIGLDDSGYYYVPSGCTGANKCPLHIFFHGCTLGNQAYQPEFVRRISYLKLAETNRIIMLFPRAAPQSGGRNALGCWDVFGLNGDNYATKDSVQISAVRKMISRLYGQL